MTSANENSEFTPLQGTRGPVKKWRLTRRLLTAIGVIAAFYAWGAPSASAQSCTATPPGITAWWPANGSANDIVANHRGTLHGGVTFAPGVNGEAFNFDGATGYVDIPSSPALQPPTAISITAWIKPTSLAPYPWATAIISKYDSTEGGGHSWWLAIQNSGQINWYIQDAQTPADAQVFTVENVALSDWQHVAATFDTASQSIAVYLNGQPAETISYTTGGVTSISQSTADVLIGAYDAGAAGYFYGGQIDEVQLYRVALTPEQVLAIYNAGSSGVCAPAWRASHHYYKGDEVHDPTKHVQVVVTGGTSGTTKPAWNDAGGTTTDGSVTWQDRGLEP